MKRYNREIKVGEHRFIGEGHRPFIIAEMACAHDGSFSKVKQLIDAAVEAKADAVQLQFFIPNSTVTRHHEAYDILQKIKFDKEQWRDLFNYGREQDIAVFVCTYDLPSVEWAAEFGADGIKLNSADLSNPEIIIATAKSGIPFTLGTGASTLYEVNEGLRIAAEHGAHNAVLMHGVQNFPTAIDNLNISRIQLLKNVFPNLPVGYADHTDASDPFAKQVDLIAVGLGVNVLEKHITVDRSEKGIDYQAALEPAEFTQYVNLIHQAYTAYGSTELKNFTASDLKYRKFQKKSIVAARNLKKGETIARNTVEFLRNDVPGLAPVHFDKIIGKQLKRDVSAYENILPELMV